MFTHCSLHIARPRAAWRAGARRGGTCALLSSRRACLASATRDLPPRPCTRRPAQEDLCVMRYSHCDQAVKIGSAPDITSASSASRCSQARAPWRRRCASRMSQQQGLLWQLVPGTCQRCAGGHPGITRTARARHSGPRRERRYLRQPRGGQRSPAEGTHGRTGAGMHWQTARRLLVQSEGLGAHA